MRWKHCGSTTRLRNGTNCVFLHGEMTKNCGHLAGTYYGIYNQLDIYIYIFVFIFIYTYTCRYAYMCIHIYVYTNKWDCLKIGYPHFQRIYIYIYVYIYCWIGYPSSLGFRAGFGRAEAAYLHKSSPFLVGCHPQNARCMALGLPVYHGLPHNFSS